MNNDYHSSHHILVAYTEPRTDFYMGCHGSLESLDHIAWFDSDTTTTLTCIEACHALGYQYAVTGVSEKKLSGNSLFFLSIIMSPTSGNVAL